MCYSIVFYVLPACCAFAKRRRSKAGRQVWFRNSIQDLNQEAVQILLRNFCLTYFVL